MKKKNKNKIVILLLLVMFVLVGCTKQLKSEDGKAVKNPTTGQSLTQNILCKPEDKETYEIYTKYKDEINLEELPSCKNFSITSGGYEGIWTSVFIKPLAWAILKIGKFVKSNGLALIIASLIIRLIAFPITKKTAMQSELMKAAKPDLDRLEKKYANKTDNDSMMRKSQEMAMIYKKYNLNPITGCIFALIQLPLFIAFLEAINRVPAIYEETFLGFQLGTVPLTGITNGNFIYIILTLLVGASTYYSLKVNSASNPDNAQVKTMNKVMFFMILVMSVFMSSALNIYWITTNAFTIVQNLLVMKKRKKV